MSSSLTEPAETPDERQGLEEFLDYFRAVMRRKVTGLGATVLNRTVASSLTLGGIIKHLSLVEETWFVEEILGQELSEPWSAMPTSSAKASTEPQATEALVSPDTP